MALSYPMAGDSQQLLTWLRRALLLVLSVLLLLVLVQLFWRLLDSPQVPDSTLMGAADAPATTRSNVLPIGRWSLFGRDVAPGAGGMSLAEPTRETGLDLTLRGTFSDPDTESGYAIIAVANEQEQFYRVGDEVTSGATLQRILRDRVVLSRAGELETLSLPELRESFAAGGSSRPRSSGPAVRGQASMPVAPSGRIGGIGAPGTIAGNEWQAARERYVQDPAALAREVQVIPVVDPSTGQLAGVRLNPGRESTLMQRAGLLPSDTITEVNGIRLDNLSRGRELINSLSTAERVSVTLRRDGREQTLEISLQ